MITKPNKNFNLTLDLIRLIAIFSAVGIHLVNGVYGRADFVGGKLWWLSNIVNSFSRFSVPVFIILSGYLNLGKDINFQNLQKKINKIIIIPLVSWLTIYTLWGHFLRHESINLKNIIFHLFLGEIGPLYFLIILLGLYFITPLINILYQKNKQLFQKYLIAFIAITTISGLVEYFLCQDIRTNTIFNMWIPYASYFIYGLWARQNQLKLSKDSKLWFLGFSLSWIAIALASFYALVSLNPSLWSGSINYFENYLSIPVIFMSISFFNLFLLNQDLVNKALIKFQKHIRFLSQLSFGVYLSHSLVSDIVDNLFNFKIISSNSSFSTPIWQYLLIRPLLVYSFSFIFTFILSKIKFIKKIIGK